MGLCVTASDPGLSFQVRVVPMRSRSMCLSGTAASWERTQPGAVKSPMTVPEHPERLPQTLGEAKARVQARSWEEGQGSP